MVVERTAATAMSRKPTLAIRYSFGMLSHSEILLRLGAAAALGAAIGLERERLAWAAGLRTHMLVSVGAALLMIVSAFGFEDVRFAEHVVLDPSRVAAQVVSGIGFIGAGTILFLRQKVIRGLTTAASLWTTAAVGLAVGGGLFVAAFATTGIVLVILLALKPLERRLFRARRRRRLAVDLVRGTTTLSDVQRTLDDAGLDVAELTVTRDDDGRGDRIVFLCAEGSDEARLVDAVGRLQRTDGVRRVTL